MKFGVLFFLSVGTLFSLTMLAAYCMLVLDLIRKAFAGEWGYWIPVIILCFIAGKVFSETAKSLRNKTDSTGVES